MRSIIKYPLLTEKTNRRMQGGVYTFVVEKSATKTEIAKAISDIYHVNVDSVKTLIMPRKVKTRYTKTAVISGSSPAYKKAIVALKDGEIIDLYDNAQAE